MTITAKIWNTSLAASDANDGLDLVEVPSHNLGDIDAETGGKWMRRYIPNKTRIGSKKNAFTSQPK